MGGGVPEGADELAGLERRREELYRELGQVGDLRCREASSTWEAICNTPHTQTRTA